MKLAHGVLVAALASSALAACAADSTRPIATPATEPAPLAPSAAPSAAATVATTRDDELGDRLFDHLVRCGTSARGFEPDASKTKGRADGKGGAKGDGTLLLGTGAPLLNDAGHDYRLKNLFGWDRRGKEGVYGPKYMPHSDAVFELREKIPGS